ncbi:fructose bisphosphate aldolase [Microbacterium marinilacus]|uniref:fructose-bisphosphate aldolase n=1 Tax=Microbacterium marinilacus TaxID=415209 RepID=A0ABP7BKB5_9MICO|nr:fructose bisphosphate aldolase [Microbacterium marinilacus]MBY0687602.1 fructose bisphosphate aldolase [Microbacterium marinilacus]
MPDATQLARFESGQGFIAALDQSGGSTPKALALYGIDESRYATDAEMFDLIHAARTRVITSPAFTSERILGAILFEGTLDREIDGQGVAEYLWGVKGIIPFLKIDKGLETERDGVQPMREIPDLDALLSRAAERGIFGTKERSVIHAAHPAGIELVVTQQFRIAEHVLAAGLVPVLEPEVDIHAPDKAAAEELLKVELLRQLDDLPGSGKVAVKVTIPTVAGFYTNLIAHPRIARVVALSGGYDRDEANQWLARNPGLIASFSRALLDGLTAPQSEEEFDRTLDTSIESIYRASIA